MGRALQTAVVLACAFALVRLLLLLLHACHPPTLPPGGALTPLPAASRCPQAQCASSQDADLDSKYLCRNLTDSQRALPQLKIQQSLSSNKQRQPTDVTLITQLSFER